MRTNNKLSLLNQVKQSMSTVCTQRMPECGSQFLRVKDPFISKSVSDRKSKRRSKLFPSLDRNEKDERDLEEMGSGRTIPVRQGYLYKKSGGSFTKEWKKKYVTLCNTRVITLHPSLHDYMENINAKEIPLECVTVKVPGQAPRGSSVRGQENRRDRTVSACVCQNSADTPGTKKRNRRRTESVNGREHCEVEPFEFQIVCLNEKVWQFEAGSASDRDDWVRAIELQILTSLQANMSNKAVTRTSTSTSDKHKVAKLKCDTKGNSKCVDCDSPNPNWSSLNLGVLICIECSGIHRNLGSHISRVRSLDLDDWPSAHLATMTCLGNTMANSVWEGRTLPGHCKPGPGSGRAEKEKYIDSKYVKQEWISPIPTCFSPSKALLDAIMRSDMFGLYLALAHCNKEDVNCQTIHENGRTPLHVAAAGGNTAILQILLWVRLFEIFGHFLYI